jgi:hypothetical protein
VYRSAIRGILLSVLVISSFTQGSTDYRVRSLAKQEPQPIYSADVHDTWNRIFYLLFTRTVESRLTEDFDVEAQFSPIATMGNESLPVTTGTFRRVESGDQPVDPLYPNFLSTKGAEVVLEEPQFRELKQALQEACSETAPRSPLHRALMQSDAWDAYDILSWLRQDQSQLGERARALLPLLDQFIGKLALSSQEIAALPRNYEAAQTRLHLPDVFDEKSGWVEVEWFPFRSHDAEVGDRRAARVFLKPTTEPEQFLAEVNHRIKKHEDPLPSPTSSLDAAALVTEGLLVDRGGRVVPSPITYDVQLRTFARDVHRQFQLTTVVEYELSRKLLLADPTSGGLVAVTADDPAYLPASGNDFTFASPTLEMGSGKAGPPILGNLRRRCQSCHGQDPGSIFTFLINVGPKAPPEVHRLRPADDGHARFVAQEKMKRADFGSLHPPN